MCPENGSRFRDHASTFFDYTNRETICVLPLCEAAAAWRLWNHHASQAPAGKRILRLNLDETRVNYFLKAGLGNISMNKHSRPWQRVSKHHLRAGITHVGFICDDTSLQPLLPQVLIVNGATVLKRDMAAVLASLPNNYSFCGGRAPGIMRRSCVLSSTCWGGSYMRKLVSASRFCCWALRGSMSTPRCCTRAIAGRSGLPWSPLT